jgi:putative redox protein
MGMKAHVMVEWTGQGHRFTGHNPSGITVPIDGDQQAGSSPMMLLLHAEAGCTGIDVVSILQKIQQPVEGLRIEVEAEKGEGDYPRVWEKIHLRYIISGAVNPAKAQHAIELSLGKYCSVSAMLHHTAVVTSELVMD